MSVQPSIENFDAMPWDGTPESATAAVATVGEGKNGKRAMAVQLFDLGTALARLREGRKVQRAGWNGKGMWIKLVQTETYPAGNLCGHPFENPIDVMAHICLYTADGKWQPGWVCSQEDLLATDWQLAD
jgi:hypothetical protein